MKISVFESAKSTKPKSSILFDQYLEDVKNGVWQDVVIKVRKVKQIGTKQQYQDAKAKAPAVTASGVFSYRNINGLEAHSSIIAIDIDAQDNQNGIPIDVLATDVYTYALHRSIGGDGVVVYVKIDPEKHLDAFLGLETYYLNNYQVLSDPSCKDVSRLRYVSWDSDLVVNPKAKIFKQYLPAKTREPKNVVYTQTNNDIEHIISQLTKRGINITGNYRDFMAVGMGIAKEYGEMGRQYLHAINQICPKYVAANVDKHYTAFVKNCQKYNWTIGSFIWLAAQNGVETKTERTHIVENIAKTRRAMVGQNGGLQDVKAAKEAALKFLAQNDGIQGEDVEKVVDKVMQMSNQEAKILNNEGEIFDKVLAYMKAIDLKFNEVTRCVEWNGVEIRDMDVNTIYIQCKTALGKRVTKGDIENIINSDIPTPYHPFKEFFRKYANARPEGLIDDVVDCFEYENNDNPDYRQKMKEFIIRWLISVVAQMHGTYSILCLVLCGRQGISKTRFFRNLLPPELQKYFAESTLDNGKDDELLMARKIIVLDDEFAGKSKKEIDKMKAVLSKENFYLRRPYGKVYEDVPRYAVLCGTSNNEEILADVANRRIIPCNIKSFDFEKYKSIDKVLLWCELYHAYNEIGEGWMLDKQDIEDLKRLAATNKQATQEEEAVAAFFKLPEAGDYGVWLTNTEIKNHIETGSRLKLSSTKLGVVLKAMGYQKRDVKINGTSLPRYFVVKLEQGVQPYNPQSTINTSFS